MRRVIDEKQLKRELFGVTTLFRKKLPFNTVFEMQHSNRSCAHAHEEKKKAKGGLKQTERLKFRRARAASTYGELL